MKSRKIIIIAVLLAFIIVLGCALSVFFEYTRKTAGSETITVEIPFGSSEKAIANILEEKGVIKHALSFRIKMKLSPARGKLNYGTYEMKKNMVLDEIIDMMLHQGAKEEGIKLTIPEGFSAEMIAARCEELKLIGKDEFLNELENGTFDYDFIKDIPKKNNVKYRLQGYLFPNTYVFKKDATAHDIISVLLGEFEKQYDKVKSLNKTDMDMNDIIILASLVEREAKIPQEREKIAGVINNRLKSKMRLQVDASVIYAVTDGMYDIDRVLYKHLKIDSPYNTYVTDALPQGAICSPGIEAIKAAMNPSKHNYLYYHTDEEKGDGSHVFNETFSAHKE